MLALLPFFVYILLWITLRKVYSDWRRAILMAALIWGVWLTVFTEFLSLFQTLTVTGLVIAWGLGALAIFAYGKSQSPFHRVDASISIGVQNGAHSRAPLPGFVTSPHLPINTFDRILLLGIGVIVLIVGFIALVAPPNTWDSMTYHLARVAHWTQNRSVAFYPASDQRQLYQHPWAEYVITQLQVLSGGDRFANLGQWFSMVGSIIGVSAIAQQWGLDRRGQIFAAVLCATIPMGILQGSGSQNDYVLTFWLVGLAYNTTRLTQQDTSRSALLGVAASLGLAVATKATAYLYTLPFVVWIAVILLKQPRRRFWQYGLFIVVIAAILPAPHWLRNTQLFGSPLGPLAGDYTNEVFYPNTFASNVIRNVALHLVVPEQLGIRSAAEDVIKEIHDWLDVDINDPRITFPHQTFALPAWTMHEDLAPAPFHLALFFAAAVIYVLARCLKQSRMPDSAPLPAVMGYLLAVGVGFLLFCLALQWQPWHARLHLPFLVLIAPFTAYVLARVLPRKIMASVAVFLLILAIFPLFLNTSRALLAKENNILTTNRATLYFANMPGMQETYTTITRLIQEQDCAEVGLAIVDGGEYPLWTLLGRSTHIEHVNTPFLPTGFSPCAIIALSAIAGDTYTVGDTVYDRAWTGNRLALFLPHNTP